MLARRVSLNGGRGCFAAVAISLVLQPLRAEDTTQEITQSAEVVALDDRLAKEMDDYRTRYREFRRTLREKYPKGEDRIAALEKWAKDHKSWNADWERRKKDLDGKWNWGPGGKPKTPERVEDLSTASGRVGAAIRKIRSEEKGTGRAGDRIAKWMKENKELMGQADAERAVPSAPEDNRQLKGTPEEVELGLARRELNRIRKELLAQGMDALKAAMRNPDSEYSQQKKIVIEKTEATQRTDFQSNTITQPENSK